MVNRIYLQRKLEARIQRLAGYFPAVVIVGPRQVGKTSLSLALRNQLTPASVYLDLERPDDLSALANLESFVEQHPNELLIFDEIQRKPSLFPELRSLIDRNRRPGRFLLLGSGSLDLIRDASETLAGRIAIEELTGLLYSEVADQVSWATHWQRGGFPDSLLAPGEELSLLWRDNFVRTYLERDLPQFGVRGGPNLLHRFFTMLAHLSIQQLNTQQLTKALQIDHRTVERYLDIMESTFLIRRLPAYHSNTGKRLIKRPKVYLRDTGILHALLDIDSPLALAKHPIYGAMFESYVVEQLYVLSLTRRVQLYYYRTTSGNEIDVVITRGGLVRAVVEIKTAVEPKLSRGFYSARTDLGEPPGFVVCPTDQGPYSLNEHITVVGLAQLEIIFESAAA